MDSDVRDGVVTVAHAGDLAVEATPMAIVPQPETINSCIDCPLYVTAYTLTSNQTYTA
jgi:hypothetical protein